MNGVAFIDCAEQWINGSPSAGEPVLRSTVSRAYYGAFHRCREFITDVLLIRMEEGPSQHAKIPLALGFTENARLKAIGHQLDAMRKCRHQADYKILIASAGNRVGAELAVSQARSIERTLNGFNEPKSSLAAMQAAIAANFKLSLVNWSIIRPI